LAQAISGKATDTYRAHGLSCAMAPPRFSVRTGAAVVHVASEADLDLVLDRVQFRPVSHGAVPHCAAISTAAARLLEVAADVFPDASLRGLRDVAFRARGAIPAADLKFIQQLNTTYSMLRHMAPAALLSRAEAIAASLGAKRQAGRASPPQAAAGFDPWAEAAQARGLAPSQEKQGAYWQAPDANPPEENSADEGYDNVMQRIQAQLEAVELHRAQAAAQSEMMMSTLQEKLVELDLRRGQAAIAQTERLVAFESRLADVEAQLAAAEEEGDQAERRIAALEDDLDSTDRKVDSLMARLGDHGIADVLWAVQAAAEERRSIEDAIMERLAALEAPSEPGPEVCSRMVILEAHQRAAERTMLELRRAVNELVVADALFPRKHAAARPTELQEVSPAESSTVHLEGEPPPNEAADFERHGNPIELSEAAPETVAASSFPAHACGFLSRAELCQVRAVSTRHACLPGLGSPAPRALQQPRVRHGRPIGFGSGPAASSFVPWGRARVRATSLGGRPRVVARRRPDPSD